MKKKFLFSLLIVAVMIVSLTVGVLAADASTTDGTFVIAARSISLKDAVRVNFKVTVPNDADISTLRLLVWEGKPSDTDYDKATTFSDVDENGDPVDRNAVVLSAYTQEANTGYYVFQYAGVAAKEMGKTLYARAYYEKNGETVYTAPIRYSVAQYLYNMKNAQESLDESSQNKELLALMDSILAYGDAAMGYFGADERPSLSGGMYVVTVSGGTFDDGFTAGKFLASDTVTLIAPEIAGKTFLGWKKTVGETENVIRESTVTVTEDAAYTAVYEVIKNIEITAPAEDRYTLDDSIIFDGIETVTLTGDWSGKTLAIDYSGTSAIDISYDGEIDKIEVNAPNAEITLNGMTVETLTVTKVASNTLTLSDATVGSATLEEGHINVAGSSNVEKLELIPTEEGAKTKLTVSSDTATVIDVTVNTNENAEPPQIVVAENATIANVVANNDKNDIAISGDGAIEAIEVNSADNHIVIPEATKSGLTIFEKSGIGATVAVVDEARKAILDIIEDPDNNYDFIQYEQDFLETVKEVGATIALGDTDDDGLPITHENTIELLDNQYIYLNGCSITVKNGPVFRVTGKNVVIAGSGGIIGNGTAAAIEIAEGASLSLNGGTVEAKGDYAAVTTSGTLEILAGMLLSEYKVSEEGHSYITVSVDDGSDGTIRAFGGTFYGQDPTAYLANQNYGVATVCPFDVTSYTVCPNSAHVTSADEFINAVNQNVAGMLIYVDEDITFNDSVTIRNTTHIRLKANISFNQGGFIVDGSEAQALSVEVHFYGGKDLTVKAGPNSPVIHVIGTDTRAVTRNGWTTYTGTPIEGEVDCAEPLLKATAGGRIDIWSGHFDNTYNRQAGGHWGYADDNSDIVFADTNTGGTALVYSYVPEHNPIYTRHTSGNTFVEEQTYQDEDGNDVYKFFVSTTDAWRQNGYIGGAENSNLYIQKAFIMRKPLENTEDCYYVDLSGGRNFYSVGSAYAFEIEESEGVGTHMIINGDGELVANGLGIAMHGGALDIYGSVSIETKGGAIVNTWEGGNIYISGDDITLTSSEVAMCIVDSRVHIDGGVHIVAESIALEIGGNAPVYDDRGEWVSGTWVGISDASVITNGTDQTISIGVGSLDIWGENTLISSNGNIDIYVDQATVNIQNGTFIAQKDAGIALWDSCHFDAEGDCCITVEGGKFLGQDPSPFITNESLTVTQDEEGYFTVTAVTEE